VIKLIEKILEDESILDLILSEGCIVLSMYDPYESTRVNPKQYFYKVDLGGVDNLQDLLFMLRIFLNSKIPQAILHEETIELYNKVLIPIHKELVDKCDTRSHIISKSYFFFSPIDGDRVESLNTFDFIDRIVRLYNRNFKLRDYDCSWISN
jgi:hypothetical protein